jgi:2-polyprenyl-3-methyl-5-hydroxy-6-metoxy-1,4-benzoquinol methylase
MTDRPADRREYWNQRYDTEGLIYGAEPNRFVVDSLVEVPAGRALDLACGQGRNAVWLAARGHHVTAVDFSEVAIGHARQLAADAQVEIEFHAADLTSWVPPPGQFDLVLLSYLQLPAADRTTVHRRAAAALAPGGTLFLVAHHRDNLERGIGGPQSAEVLYDEAQMTVDFDGLDVTRNEMVTRHVVTEDLEGDALDIVVVARKPAGK